MFTFFGDGGQQRLCINNNVCWELTTECVNPQASKTVEEDLAVRLTAKRPTRRSLLEELDEQDDDRDDIVVAEENEGDRESVVIQTNAAEFVRASRMYALSARFQSLKVATKKGGMVECKDTVEGTEAKYYSPLKKNKDDEEASYSEDSGVCADSEEDATPVLSLRKSFQDGDDDVTPRQSNDAGAVMARHKVLMSELSSTTARTSDLTPENSSNDGAWGRKGHSKQVQTIKALDSMFGFNAFASAQKLVEGQERLGKCPLGTSRMEEPTHPWTRTAVPPSQAGASSQVAARIGNDPKANALLVSIVLAAAVAERGNATHDDSWEDIPEIAGSPSQSPAVVSDVVEVESAHSSSGSSSELSTDDEDESLLDYGSDDDSLDNYNDGSFSYVASVGDSTSWHMKLTMDSTLDYMDTTVDSSWRRYDESVSSASSEMSYGDNADVSALTAERVAASTPVKPTEESIGSVSGSVENSPFWRLEHGIAAANEPPLVDAVSGSLNDSTLAEAYFPQWPYKNGPSVSCRQAYTDWDTASVAESEVSEDPQLAEDVVCPYSDEVEVFRSGSDRDRYIILEMHRRKQAKQPPKPAIPYIVEMMSSEFSEISADLRSVVSLSAEPLHMGYCGRTTRFRCW